MVFRVVEMVRFWTLFLVSLLSLRQCLLACFWHLPGPFYASLGAPSGTQTTRYQCGLAFGLEKRPITLQDKTNLSQHAGHNELQHFFRFCGLLWPLVALQNAALF